MTVVFDGTVFTSYSQLELGTSGGIPIDDVRDAFKGQVNGLCGASVRGTLFLVTGIHTGDVPIQVNVVDAAPELGGWEEIVEVSLQSDGTDAGLCGWGESPTVSFQLDAPSYRVRWCASGMDAGKAQDVADETNPAPDKYALYLWPAPVSGDAVVRRTSEVAAYWHDHGFIRP